jgi:hypothetical protein
MSDTATYILTREYLAQVAPDRDPDQAPVETLDCLLGDDFDAWIDQHPDHLLVARYHQEVQAELSRMTFDFALHLSSSPGVKSVTLEHTDGRLFVMHRIDEE